MGASQGPETAALIGNCYDESDPMNELPILATLVLGFLGVIFSVLNQNKRFDDSVMNQNRRFDDLKEMLEIRFDQIDRRFDEIERRLQRIENKLDNHEARITRLEEPLIRTR